MGLPQSLEQKWLSLIVVQRSVSIEASSAKVELLFEPSSFHPVINRLFTGISNLYIDGRNVKASSKVKFDEMLEEAIENKELSCLNIFKGPDADTGNVDIFTQSEICKPLFAISKNNHDSIISSW